MCLEWQGSRAGLHKPIEEQMTLPPVPPVRPPDAGHGATYLPLLDSNLLLLFLLLILLFFSHALLFWSGDISSVSL